MASATVRPCETHPGSSGQLATIHPSSSCSRMTWSVLTMGLPYQEGSRTSTSLYLGAPESLPDDGGGAADVLDFESNDLDSGDLGPEDLDFGDLESFELESRDLDSAAVDSFGEASLEEESLDEESGPDPEDSVLWAFLRDSDG